MALKIFKPDSPLMVTMTEITDAIFLSLFWMLGCLPVITAGASFAALYDSVYRGFRKGEKHSWGRFWSVFRSNWKGGIVPTVIVLVLIWALVKGLVYFWNLAVAGSLSWMAFAAVGFVGIVVLGILSVLFPVLSRFENSLGGLLKNTLFLAMANLPRTVGLGFLNAVMAFACIRFVVPVFFLPAVAALLGSLFLEPMFKPYLPKEPETEPGIEDAAE